MTSFLTLISGRHQLQSLPVRSAGWLQLHTGIAPNQGWLSEPDGIWVCLSLPSITRIGPAGTSASIAQSWCQTLFQFLWSNFDNSRCAVFSSSGATVSRGTSALADWQSNRIIALPDYRGRVIVGAGQAQLTLGAVDRVKGTLFGSDTHTLTLSEIPSHSHSVNAGFRSASVTGNSALLEIADPTVTSPGGAISTTSGGGSAHNNCQLSAAENLYISAGTKG